MTITLNFRIGLPISYKRYMPKSDLIFFLVWPFIYEKYFIYNFDKNVFIRVFYKNNITYYNLLIYLQYFIDMMLHDVYYDIKYTLLKLQKYE